MLVCVFRMHPRVASVDPTRVFTCLLEWPVGSISLAWSGAPMSSQSRSHESDVILASCRLCFDWLLEAMCVFFKEDIYCPFVFSLWWLACLDLSGHLVSVMICWSVECRIWAINYSSVQLHDVPTHDKENTDNHQKVILRRLFHD